jgi:sarcosine oxidase, subunit alpha
MGSLEFEGRAVPVGDGDTVASALFRAGVRTFTRSLKYHRRRGLYCLTGDCPNCLVNVDGQPGVRACTAEARDGQRVHRESGWPSAERDLLAVADRLHAFMPVAFYSKTFIRPRFAWPLAERVIRRATGVGALPVETPPAISRTRHATADVLVVGGGIAGLAAAIEARRTGVEVLLCDEGRLGEKLPLGPVRARIDALADEAADLGVELCERTTAVGVYEGPLVPLVRGGETIRVEPGRVIVATGATEQHAVFRGNDLPGVWLGRGAARLAGVHGVRPGARAVVVSGSTEGLEHAEVLREAGVEIAALVLTPELASEAAGAGAGRADVVIEGGSVISAEGRGRVASVTIAVGGQRRRIACDTLVLSLGLAPRDGLLRMAGDEPVVAAGDAAVPGCSPEEAEASGRRAGVGEDPGTGEAAPVRFGNDGYVCLCEDVGAKDLEAAWREGWRSSEILKRYTTATMGPCQGAVCGRLLAAFVAARRPEAPAAGARTTARPPARPARLEELAAGVQEVIDKRTALHDRHVALGARLDRSGSWQRPYHYGDHRAEYRAVRDAVGMMDVSTLGKFLVAGPDAWTLLDRVFPCRTDDLTPGRSRYLVMLDEAGYVMDDGLLCAVDDDRAYLTSTSGGADRMEAWLRDWADRWDLRVHVVNQTSMLGAVLVAGPRARDLLARRTDDDLSREGLPHMTHGEVVIAGVPCRAIRTGFVGEVAFELHHPRSRGVELWDALLGAGEDLGVRPFGLDALDLLRLEKGHVYLGQDTLPDDHPGKLGLGFTVAMDKPAFLGKVSLQRMGTMPLPRRLVGLVFDGSPQRGAPLGSGGTIVGRVTSCGRSEVLGRDIGLGWVRVVDGVVPSTLRADGVPATVVDTPFYDPEGTRLRG